MKSGPVIENGIASPALSGFAMTFYRVIVRSTATLCPSIDAKHQIQRIERLKGAQQPHINVANKEIATLTAKKCGGFARNDKKENSTDLKVCFYKFVETGLQPCFLSVSAPSVPLSVVQTKISKLKGGEKINDRYYG